MLKLVNGVQLFLDSIDDSAAREAHRPGKVEGGALTQLRLQPNPTSSGFDDFFDDAQTDPRAIGIFLRVDGLENDEYSLALLWRDAWAIITDRKFIEFA